MSMENQKEIGDQLRKINIENARKEKKRLMQKSLKKKHRKTRPRKIHQINRMNLREKI